MKHCRLGLAPIALGWLVAFPAYGETVGEVVLTNEVVCGWIGDAEPTCDDEKLELRQKSSIDRGMTVRSEGPAKGGHRIACAMTIDELVVGGGGVVIMQPRTMIRFSSEVLTDFELAMDQLAGVIRIVLPKRDRKLLVRAGKAFIVLRGTYVEIGVDESTGHTSVGVIEGTVSVTGLVVPEAPEPPVLPDTPPEGAMRSRVNPGEKVTVLADGFISPPVPFPPGAPAGGPTMVIEDGGISPGPGMAVPEGPRLPDQICDLPRGVCG